MCRILNEISYMGIGWLKIRHFLQLRLSYPARKSRADRQPQKGKRTPPPSTPKRHRSIPSRAYGRGRWRATGLLHPHGRRAAGFVELTELSKRILRLCRRVKILRAVLHACSMPAAAVAARAIKMMSVVIMKRMWRLWRGQYAIRSQAHLQFPKSHRYPPPQPSSVPPSTSPARPT
jgi:hypothetical protein